LRSVRRTMTISNRVPLGEQLILDLEENPFAEYMWMENEEEFDRQVEEELWEQDFIESCFNQMLEEEEQWEWFIPSRDLPQHSAPCLPPSTSTAQAPTAPPGRQTSW
uniref:Polyadenylate-binding protein-interacting protein 2 n=1 Tax=Neogobius melanostomus TaxID=47308 RepID=A0A8C6WHS8_9GOBI